MVPSRGARVPRGRLLDRLRLRRAAHLYASHGWMVVPGAHLRDGRFHCSVAGCPTVGCHPALPDWQRAATRDPSRIVDWWGTANRSVLLATGIDFDVLELAGALGRSVARTVGGPVAVAPGNRWMFVVRTGGRLTPALAEHPAVVLHRDGSWIPAPPTPLAEGRVRWVVPPGRHDWHLPEAAQVQRALLRAWTMDVQARAVWRHTNAAANLPTT